jgi:hypothetical protein
MKKIREEKIKAEQLIICVRCIRYLTVQAILFPIKCQKQIHQKPLHRRGTAKIRNSGVHGTLSVRNSTGFFLLLYFSTSVGICVKFRGVPRNS